MGATARLKVRQGETVLVVSTGWPTGLRRTGSATHPHCSAVLLFDGMSLQAEADNAKTKLSQCRFISDTPCRDG
jgi:hypothetical protein